MRFAAFIVILASLSESCRQRQGRVEVTVISAESQAIVVGVANDSGNDVVLLSPATPSRMVNEDRCAVDLSTKIDERIRPFAFTPQLVTLRDGEKRQFRAALHPLRLSEACAHWRVVAEYAYIRPDEVDRFRGRAAEDFREYVLKNQQIVSTSASVVISKK